MKKGRSWAAFDIFMFEHPIFQSLTPLQQSAFFKTVMKAKQLRRGNEFRDKTYLANLLGIPYARAIPRLIAEGLLEESASGIITIPNYFEWQVDSTAAERQRRHRARIAAQSRDSHDLYINGKETERKKDTLSNHSGVLSVGEIIARGAKA